MFTKNLQSLNSSKEIQGENENTILLSLDTSSEFNKNKKESYKPDKENTTSSFIASKTVQGQV